MRECSRRGSLSEIFAFPIASAHKEGLFAQVSERASERTDAREGSRDHGLKSERVPRTVLFPFNVALDSVPGGVAVAR